MTATRLLILAILAIGATQLPHHHSAAAPSAISAISLPADPDLPMAVDHRPHRLRRGVPNTARAPFRRPSGRARKVS